MKIFTTRQIAEIDRYTIENEPISDIDLMERASGQVTHWIKEHFSADQKMVVLSGPGNNGGDAMAVARMLAEEDDQVEIFLLDLGQPLKGSPAINWQKLTHQGKVKQEKIFSEKDFPLLTGAELIIDGLFGSGLNRPLEGLAVQLVHHINASGCTIIAIDIPSGLFGEDNSKNNLDNVVKSNYTLTFQFPKLSFFFPEHEEILGHWEVLPIGLHPEAIQQKDTPYFFLNKDFISKKIPPRKKFSHKGTYGHALLIAGSYGKMGAAVLASKAALRSGVGLLTAHVPHEGYQVIHNTVPESLVSIDSSEKYLTELPDLSVYSAIGIGPGLGKHEKSKEALERLLQSAPAKLVMDADALNILSENKAWFDRLPANTILTPHPKEFERLTGPSENSFVRLQKQMDFSKRYQVIIVLKGAYTSISLPEGHIYFNTTGNPGMATAGSGDVLTGIILGLLAQQYNSVDAALIGVYLHGLAGDLACFKKGEYALIASDIVDLLGKAFLQLA